MINVTGWSLLAQQLKSILWLNIKATLSYCPGTPNTRRPPPTHPHHPPPTPATPTHPLICVICDITVAVKKFAQKSSSISYT